MSNSSPPPHIAVKRTIPVGLTHSLPDSGRWLTLRLRLAKFLIDRAERSKQENVKRLTPVDTNHGTEKRTVWVGPDEHKGLKVVARGRGQFG